MIDNEGRHVITILIEDDNTPDSDEELAMVIDLFEDWWRSMRQVEKRFRGVHLTRFRSGGLL